MTKFIEPISNHARKILRENYNNIYSAEYTYKRPITIAQKGNKFLVNAGVKTGVLCMKDIKKPTDFIDFVRDMVAQNLKIKRHGSLNRFV